MENVVEIDERSQETCELAAAAAHAAADGRVRLQYFTRQRWLNREMSVISTKLMKKESAQLFQACERQGVTVYWLLQFLIRQYLGIMRERGIIDGTE